MYAPLTEAISRQVNKRMKIIFISIFFLCACAASKRHLLTDIEENTVKEFSPDSVLRNLQRRNDLIIGYSVNSNWIGVGPNYQLFALKHKKWIAYQYIPDGFGGKHYILDSFHVEKNLGDSVLLIFKRTRTWELRNTINDAYKICPDKHPSEVLCNYIIDLNSYSLVILTKTHQNNFLGFYEPYIFENCCPEWSERNRFLETINPIKRFFKNIKK